ncbi:hypothetical protein GWK47_018255 [Chionoecetes opilio]|uniref:Uncharacterized protein n=1 Tax=Chionoecetes opilio TaxID=41210 RepID=A0A8J5CGN4_CHIOP|nr:hypothetical protein GWK47_018255 [Chionoecetes opilio]
MLAGTASLVHGTRAPTVTRTPASVTPEKCEMEMTAAEFRMWRRSVESWVALAGWPDNAATLHIRLNCISSLKHAIDARYSADRWEQLSPREALDAIAGIVLESANQAVMWEHFFTSKQSVGKHMKKFFQRCALEQSLYLSFDTCKGLGLLPPGFPHHAGMVAVTNACGEALQCVARRRLELQANYVPPRARRDPFAPLEENVKRLEEWLLRTFVVEHFQNTERSPLPVMAGTRITSHLLPRAQSYACHIPASVTQAWEAEVKAQLRKTCDGASWSRCLWMALESDHLHRIYLTRIMKSFECDAFFPSFDSVKFKLLALAEDRQVAVPSNPQSLETQIEAAVAEARQIPGAGFADMTGEDIREMIQPPAVTADNIMEEDDVAREADSTEEEEGDDNVRRSKRILLAAVTFLLLYPRRKRSPSLLHENFDAAAERNISETIEHFLLPPAKWQHAQRSYCLHLDTRHSQFTCTASVSPLTPTASGAGTSLETIEHFLLPPARWQHAQQSYCLHLGTRHSRFTCTASVSPLTPTAPGAGTSLETIEYFLLPAARWQHAQRSYCLHLGTRHSQFTCTASDSPLTPTAPGAGTSLETIEHFLLPPARWQHAQRT